MKTGWKITALLALLAFLLTGGLWVAALFLFGFYPFGDKTILATDMASQYMEFYTALYDMIKGGHSMLYTWNTGMGMSFFGLWAYYLSSPFTPLLLLFPREALTEGLLTLVSLKLAAAGAALSVYLSRRFGIGGLRNLLFAAAYGLSGYCVAYCFNLMWLDGVVLLPLVVLAARRLWEAEHLASPRALLPLTMVLAVLFAANFYIAYMVGLFTLLLFLGWMAVDRRGKRPSLQRFGGFLLCALLAAGLSAPVWLPTLFAIGGSYTNVGGVSLTFWVAMNPLQIPGKLAFGGFDGVTHLGSANLYSGLLTLGLVPLWFLNRAFSRRERYMTGALLFGLAVSLIFWDLDVAWHAFQTPTWFPARYSFVVIFLLVTCAARTLSRPQGLGPGAVWLSFGVTAAGMVLFGLLPQFAGDWRVSAGLLVVYGVLVGGGLLLRGRTTTTGRLPLKGLVVLTAVVFCGELTLNAVQVLTGLDQDQGFWKRGTYTAYHERQQGLMDALGTVAEEGFYRVENATARDANDGLTAGYPSVSHYSSLSNQRTFRLLGSLGMTCYVGDRYLRYYGSTSALDAVLGVRYVFSAEERRAGMTDTGAAYGDTGVYRNEYALPLGYFASREVLDFGVREGADPFQQQNAFFSSLAGEEETAYFSPLQVQVDPAAMAGTEEDKILLAPDTLVCFTIENPRAQNVLLYFDNNLDELSKVYVGGRAVNTYNDRLVTGVIDLGRQPAGTVEVWVSASGQDRWISDVCAAGFDEAAFGKLAGRLAAHSLEELRVEDIRVTGTVVAPEEGLLFTTIPWDQGWSAWVDGERVTPVRAADAFVALELPPGEHTVELRFFPKGLAAGLAVSGGTLTGLLLWTAGMARRHRKRNRRRNFCEGA